MNHYSAFGLHIASEVTLPELRPAELQLGVPQTTPDIRISRGDAGRPMPTRKDGIVFDYADPDGIYMAWPGGAAIRIKDNRDVTIQPDTGVPDSYLAFPLLGPVMAWILIQRGLVVLHASAVEIDGQCVAFLGDKMAGKSTTAAAFVRAGYKIVTDDILAIDVTDPARAIVQPAFAQVKLDEQSSGAVTIAGADALPLVFEGFPKRQHRLPDMTTRALPASHVLVLSRGGEQPGFDALDAGGAIAAIMRYGYGVRFGSAPVGREEEAARFRRAAALSRSVGFGVLHVPAQLERLEETVAFVARMIAEGDAPC